MALTNLYKSQCELGESPFWHERRKSCLWVDINCGVLYELKYETRAVQKWNINIKVSAIFEHNDGDLILGVQGGLVKFRFDTGDLNWLVELDKEILNNRCNDGACDSEGRIWVGTMDLQCVPKKGSLYCVGLDFQAIKMIDGVTIPNGLVWSIDNEHMYFIDSASRRIKSYQFNKLSGSIFLEKDIIVVPEEMGIPDGMAMDSEGMLWVALYGGFSVCRWNPKTGELLTKLDIPVPNVTNCCFVGENLGDLLITTARENLTLLQLNEFPDSGDVYVLKDVGVRGLKQNKTEFG